MTREYPDAPRVGVGVVVWRDDQLLLIRRGQPPLAGAWSLPGGRQELGETIAEAGRREVMEETGLSVEIDDVITVVDFIERDDGGAIRYHYVLVDLNARWSGGEPRAGDDAVDLAWVAVSEIAAHDVWNETERVIRLGALRRRAGP